MFSDKIVVIPSLKPDERLQTLVAELKTQGFQEIVVVDDGSGADYASYFDACKEAGAVVLTHEQNKGKGAALKTAARYAIETYGENACMITADADGQHLAGDIARVAADMDQTPDALVLGSRDFGKGTPWKSLAGNRITSVFFLLICGKWVKDTQTGLRGIPKNLMRLAAEEEGDRYEYEMNFLMDAALQAPFVFTTIETVYFDDNKGSHFHPVKDALRVYARFLRFIVASVGGFVVDILLFWLLLRLFSAQEGAVVSDGALSRQSSTIILATVIARVCSGVANFLLNKYFSFKSKNPAAGEALRYFILFVCQMACSAAGTAALSSVTHAPTPSKIFVDVVLFFISFRIQRAWVFRK